MIYNYSDIKTVHLEITSKCNAQCPQCGRNELGGSTNPYLPITELDLPSIKKIFAEDFLAQLNRIYLCGNYGDPCMGTSTLEALQYFREVKPKINLGMNTNGGVRSKSWWSKVGEIINNNGSVKFGIDGLENTNHIYRRGVNWNKLIDNVKAFIDSGGSAHWDYIVFKHNEHQIDEARQLANSLGFKSFQVKKTGRFFSNSKMQGKDRQEVRNINGQIEYYLEKPLNSAYQNQSLTNESQIINEFKSFDNYLEQTKIHCKVKQEKSLYISAEGLAFPCCWTANQMYIWYMKGKETPLQKILRESGGKRSINAINNSLRNIIEGIFFRKLYDSINAPSLKCGKLKVCAKVCGEKFDPFKQQFA